jgi:hypothetical protein
MPSKHRPAAECDNTLSLAPRAREAHDFVMDDQPRTCPFCELRFPTHNEVKDHILHDHPEHMAMADIEIHELPR